MGSKEDKKTSDFLMYFGQTSSQNKQNWLKMYNNSLSFNKSQLTFIENMPNYCICRTNSVSVRPCEKISRTSLRPVAVFSRARLGSEGLLEVCNIRVALLGVHGPRQTIL